MSDDKQSTIEPTVVIAASQISEGKQKSRLTKKHALIAVISLLITGLVVTAVLVSIRMISDNNLEVLKYTLNANGVSQNVSTSENSVIYHVTRDNMKATIVQDFDNGLQVSKVLLDGTTTCYVTALNRSTATDPSSIPTTTPEAASGQSSMSQVIYKVLPDPIPDISFLGKKASAMCQNIPTYHAVPDCSQPAGSASALQNSTSVDHRSKRTPRFCAIYNNAYQCACGCCGIVCGVFTSTNCVVRFTGSSYTCTFYMSKLVAVYSIRPPPCIFGGYSYYPY